MARRSGGPTGTVTFLLTDLVGSAAAWEAEREAMAEAMARHDEIVAKVVAAHGGVLLPERAEGDSVFAVFSSATDAVEAALRLQEALGAEPWPTIEPLVARVALHSGDATPPYRGPVVERARRLRDAAHPSQVLLSGTTAALLADSLPDGATLSDLGPHRLADLASPERLFSLTHPSLPTDLPPPNTLESARHNLPVLLTSFVGREDELAQIQKALSEDRLLTLHGTGGVGKTRLALQAAAAAIPAHPDGVCFCDLSALSDASLVPATLATSLGITEEPGREITETLCGYLAHRQALLILDNCEHLKEAVATLATRLLTSCPDLRLLATSREPLSVPGELLVPVPPMEVPAEHLDLEELAATEAVALFADRASLSDPGFSLAEHAEATAEVCRALEGLPLSIELAAARVRDHAPKEILDALTSRLDAFTGPRDAPERHRSLRAALSWSYDLLGDDPQHLLGRFSVFSGGCTLEAAEGICNTDLEVLPALALLIDAALVRHDLGADRYSMLETVRAFATEALQASGEAEAIRDRHATWCLSLADLAEPAIAGPEQSHWLARLEAEHDNLGSALEFLGTTGENERELHVAATLVPFWQVRGLFTEGRQQLIRALDRCGSRSVDWWKASRGLGQLALVQGHYGEAHARLESALAAFEGLGDRLEVAMCLSSLGDVARVQAEYPEARTHMQSALAAFVEVGDARGVATCHFGLGELGFNQGEHAEARAHLEAALDGFQRVGDTRGAATSRFGLGTLARRRCEYAGARSHLEEAFAAFEALGSRREVCLCLSGLGALARVQGDYPEGRARYEAALSVFEELGDRHEVAICLVGLGEVAMYQGDYAEARGRYETALATLEELGERREAAVCLSGLGALARRQGDDGEAGARYEVALSVFEDLGDRREAALCQAGLGRLAHVRGNGAEARTHLEAALATVEALGDREAVAAVLLAMGQVLRAEGDVWTAREQVTASLSAFHELGDGPGVAGALEAIGGLALERAELERAARLLGAGGAVRDATGEVREPEVHERYEADLTACRDALGDEVFEAAFSAGQALTLDEAVAEALELAEERSGDPAGEK